MSISPEERLQEEAHLAEVLQEIKRQLKHYGTVTEERREKILDVRKYIWEEMRHDNANVVAKIETAGDVVRDSLELARIERSYLSAQAALKKLELLKSSPYFGRIDFREDGSPQAEAESIYIGLSSLLDDDTLEAIIYDWRSPIASMYYDYALGRASYQTPDGPVGGEIELKRQFKIVNGEIRFAFDTGIQIGDDMLQFMLSKSSDDKMKSIVTTIQSEQNRVIRNEEHPVQIVQGAAGSGKTSIAMQRVAYLLYKYRKSIRADQMILFSPNPLFSDYVSNVLPELGEENMRQTTFQDFAEHRLDRFVRVQDRYSQMEHMLISPAGPAKELAGDSIRYKVSKDFLLVIRNYLDILAQEGMCFVPVPYGEQAWKSEEALKELFYGRFGHHQIHVRLERMEEAMAEEFPDLEERQSKKLYKKLLAHPQYLGSEPELKQMARQKVRKKIAAMKEFNKAYLFVNPLEAYKQLLRNPELYRRAAEGTEIPSNWQSIAEYTLERLETGEAPYEDVPPLLYLYESITGWSSFNSIRHVILDEAQDYSPFQYEIIRRLFPRSKLTLLGDLNQAIQPHMRIESYSFIEDLYGKEQTGIIRLTKSYRSTTEIVEFTKAMLPGGEAIEAFSRSGDKPLVVQAPEAPEAHARLVLEDFRKLQAGGAQTIAVICKTARESAEVFHTLLEAGAPEGLNLITKDDVVYRGGLVVVPVYLAKGLEFDAVIVYDASSSVYSEEDERKLFYTACTRAMHELHIYYKGNITGFVSALDPELYTAKPAIGSR